MGEWSLRADEWTALGTLVVAAATLVLALATTLLSSSSKQAASAAQQAAIASEAAAGSAERAALSMSESVQIAEAALPIDIHANIVELLSGEQYIRIQNEGARVMLHEVRTLIAVFLSKGEQQFRFSTDAIVLKARSGGPLPKELHAGERTTFVSPFPPADLASRFQATLAVKDSVGTRRLTHDRIVHVVPDEPLFG